MHPRGRLSRRDAAALDRVLPVLGSVPTGGVGLPAKLPPKGVCGGTGAGAGLVQVATTREDVGFGGWDKDDVFADPESSRLVCAGRGTVRNMAEAWFLAGGPTPKWVPEELALRALRATGVPEDLSTITDAVLHLPEVWEDAGLPRDTRAVAVVTAVCVALAGWRAPGVAAPEVVPAGKCPPHCLAPYEVVHLVDLARFLPPGHDPLNVTASLDRFRRGVDVTRLAHLVEAAATRTPLDFQVVAQGVVTALGLHLDHQVVVALGAALEGLPRGCSTPLRDVVATVVGSAVGTGVGVGERV